MSWSEADYIQREVLDKSHPFVYVEQLTCVLCGYAVSGNTCGSYPAGTPSPGERLYQRMNAHLVTWHRDEILVRQRINTCEREVDALSDDVHTLHALHVREDMLQRQLDQRRREV